MPATTPEQKRLAAIRSKLRERVLAAENHYQLLGVATVCSLNEIRGAHRYLASVFHPDRCGLADAEDLMGRVNVAYNALSDPAERRKHDTIHHVKKRACGTCKGTGVVLRQKGFTTKIAQPCTACGGTGCQ